jgi:hypothetical protein
MPQLSPPPSPERDVANIYPTLNLLSHFVHGFKP